jgi:DNA-binding response OmpR family regulator
MNGQIVVAGGNAHRRAEVQKILEGGNYLPLTCVSYSELRALVCNKTTAAVLLLYPDENDTFQIIYDAVSSIFENTTIILISSSIMHNDLVRSLKYKADEYLIEPISPSGLIASIDQNLNEARFGKQRGLLKVGDLAIDNDSLTVTLRESPLGLDPVHARLLQFFMLRPGRAFSRREISVGVWGSDNAVDDRTVDVVVGRIRDAMRHKVAIDPIRTVRSVGYAFNEQFGKVSSLPKRRGRKRR